MNERSGAGVYDIVFDRYPLQPYENNLFTHDGNPLLKYFKCDTSLIDAEEARGATCDISDVYAGDDLPGE